MECSITETSSNRQWRIVGYQIGRDIRTSDNKTRKGSNKTNKEYEKQIMSESLHERTQEGRNHTTNSVGHTLGPSCYIYG